MGANKRHGPWYPKGSRLDRKTAAGAEYFRPPPQASNATNPVPCPGPYDPDESPLKSTLEQLSDLHIPDRAGTEARPSSTAAYPFLFCSGSDAQGLSRSGAAADERAALTLFCQSGGSGTGWDTHVHLAPLSCWLNLPAAERLLAAVERLAVGMHDCAPAPEVAGCGVAVSPSTLSPAVSSQSLGTDR